MKTSSGSWPSSPGRQTRTCIHERALCTRTCIHMSLSGHAIERWLAVITQNSLQSWNLSTRANLSQHKSLWMRSPVHGESVARQIKTCRWFSLAKNSPDTRLYVHFVWDLVAPSRLVWTHKSFPTGQSWPKSPVQSLCPVFLRNEAFLSKTGLKHLSETA